MPLACFFLIIALILISDRQACSAAGALTSYHDSAWTSEDGLGAVFDIQQAPDVIPGSPPRTAFFVSTACASSQLMKPPEASCPMWTWMLYSSRVLAPYGSPPGRVPWCDGVAAWSARFMTGMHSIAQDRWCSRSRRGPLWMRARLGLAHLLEGVCDQIGFESGLPPRDRSHGLIREDSAQDSRRDGGTYGGRCPKRTRDRGF